MDAKKITAEQKITLPMFGNMALIEELKQKYYDEVRVEYNLTQETAIVWFDSLALFNILKHKLAKIINKPS